MRASALKTKLSSPGALRSRTSSTSTVTETSSSLALRAGVLRRAASLPGAAQERRTLIGRLSLGTNVGAFKSASSARVGVAPRAQRSAVGRLQRRPPSGQRCRRGHAPAAIGCIYPCSLTSPPEVSLRQLAPWRPMRSAPYCLPSLTAG